MIFVLVGNPLFSFPTQLKSLLDYVKHNISVIAIARLQFGATIAIFANFIG